MSPRVRKTLGAAALAFPMLAVSLAAPAVANDGDHHEKWYDKVETCGAITDDPRCDEGGMDLWWKIPKEHDKWYSENEHEKGWYRPDDRPRPRDPRPTGDTYVRAGEIPAADGVQRALLCDGTAGGRDLLLAASIDGVFYPLETIEDYGFLVRVDGRPAGVILPPDPQAGPTESIDAGEVVTITCLDDQAPPATPVV